MKTTVLSKEKLNELAKEGEKVRERCPLNWMLVNTQWHNTSAHWY